MYKSYALTDGQEPISHNEIDYLAELALMLPDKPTIVNIGAWVGVSTCTFLQAKPDCIIYSIDVNPCNAEFENARKLGLDSSRIIRILGDSVATVKTSLIR
jgi:predicted O-methyltransferase YrrM